MNARNDNRNCEGILKRHVVSLSLSLGLAAAVIGCGNSNPVASQLTLASGDGQAAPIGAALMLPLVVRVSAADHRPVAGVTVSWGAGAGGGSVMAGTSTSNADGLASVNAQLGPAAGDNTFTATASGLSGSPVTFHATAKAAANLVVVSGDGQTGTAGAMLAQPLVVMVTDGYGNPVTGINVNWTAPSGGGSITPAMGSTGADGKASAMATLGAVEQNDVFQADVSSLNGSPAQIKATRNLFKLVYTDPAAGGKLRLVKNAASTGSTVVLDLVTATALTGWSAGFNLPFDGSRVSLNAAPLKAGTGLNPGSAPAAEAIKVPASGPLKGMLVSGISQKAAGAGSSAADATLPAGTVVYTIKLDLVPTAATGVVFDGTASGFKLPSGGMRDKTGTAVAAASDVLIGKLEITK